MNIYVKQVLTAVFWGGTFIAGRHVSQHLGPFTIAFLRFAMASALLLALTRRKEGRLPRLHRTQIVPIVLLGMTGIFAYNVMFFKGLKLIEAGRAALIIATCPAFIAGVSALLLKERLGRGALAGIPLSVLGAVVVVSRGDPRQITAGGVGWGELFILSCVACWVAYSLIGKAVMQKLSPLASVSYSAAVGAAALAIPATLLEGLGPNLGPASLLDWAAIAYLAIFGTVIGFVWFYEGVKLIGPTRAGLFINIVPISAVVLAFLLLGEPITWSLAAGAILVLSGVYLTNKKSMAGPRT
ncbi:MAG: DMT family transporter [Sedimentisphaerales bacterium]|nr:DMT family transporter [Sedimentisphaerales bacterium]